MSIVNSRDADQGELLAERVRESCSGETPLRIVGGNSKSRLGRAVQADELSVKDHCGIMDYVPTELVITARAGTPLSAVENALAEEGQMLPFEPPHLGENATLGGTIACGLSGPRRPYAGAARDLVLGVRIINGRGEVLSFGGQVMKNVAGYDVSRLMAGAQGTLGVLLDISLKVLPKPEYERTLVLDMDAAQAITIMNRLAGQAVPLTAACHEGNNLCLRLSSTEAAVNSAAHKIGGEVAADGQQFWLDLREQQLAFFKRSESVWRLSIPPATSSLSLGGENSLPGETLLDWGGAQRWLISEASADQIHAAANQAGGYASRYSSQDLELPPMSGGQLLLHQRLKAAFDPKGILNPGRQYRDI